MTRRTKSLRIRLAAWFALTITVVLVLFSVLTWLALGEILEGKLDDQLEADAEAALASAVAGTAVFFPRGATPEPDTPPLRWAEVRDGLGAPRIKHFPRDYEVALPVPSERITARGRAFDYSPAELPGQRLRVFEAVRQGPDGAAYAVVVARSLDPMQQELDDFLRTMGAIFPLGILLAGVAAYAIAGRMLRPVGLMAEQAERITASNLSDRLPVDDPDNELGHLATVFNRTFARLEESFERLRRFTADASHELRTPLTVLRSVGEAGLREGASAADLRDTVGSMLEEADRMTALVESLLLLARADGGEAPLSRERLDLLALCREVVEDLDILAEEKGQTVKASGDTGAMILADRGVIGLAVMNLLDNALKYSPEGTCVRLTVTRGEERHVLRVEDEGPGIPAEDLPKVFDRFYRVRPDRSRASGGTGLGLSIAHWAVTIHGGTVKALSEPGKGAVFVVRLPKAE